MKAICSERSVDFSWTTWRYTSEDGTLRIGYHVIYSFLSAWKSLLGQSLAYIKHYAVSHTPENVNLGTKQIVIWTRRDKDVRSAECMANGADGDAILPGTC
jgi:hypothetical protein